MRPKVFCLAVSLLSAAASSQGQSLAAPVAKNVTVSCSTPIGPLRSRVSYRLLAGSRSVSTGESESYLIALPAANLVPPLPSKFVSSTIAFQVPSGLVVDTVRMGASATRDYQSVAARLIGDRIVVTLRGSFSLDGSVRPIPLLEVEAHVVARPGSIIDWMPPSPIVGVADAALFGRQSSTCHVEDEGPLWTIQVAR